MTPWALKSCSSAHAVAATAGAGRRGRRADGVRKEQRSPAAALSRRGSFASRAGAREVKGRVVACGRQQQPGLAHADCCFDEPPGGPSACSSPGHEGCPARRRVEQTPERVHNGKIRVIGSDSIGAAVLGRRAVVGPMWSRSQGSTRGTGVHVRRHLRAARRRDDVAGARDPTELTELSHTKRPWRSRCEL